MNWDNRPGLGWRSNRNDFGMRRNQLGGMMRHAWNNPRGRWGNWNNHRFYDWQVWNSRSWWRHNNWHRGFWQFSLWNGFWPNYWGQYPMVGMFGLSPWGVNTLGFNFGYYDFYNPYCFEPVPFYGGSQFDYREPLVVYQNVSPNVVGGQPQAIAQAPQPDDGPDMAAFDQARSAFRNGDYTNALQQTEQLLGQAPRDAVLHEFRALTLFAMGRYADAAAPLYSLLAIGPGMDWATMSSLYADVETYSQQLRLLEEFHRQNPDEAYGSFVLAYHYLTCGHMEAAAAQLENVLRLNPQDLVAKQLLQALPGDESAEAAATARSNQALAVPDLPAPGAELQAEQFYGVWSASNERGTQFRLSLNPDGRFEWSATHNGETRTVTGVFAIEGDALAMEPEDGGVMLGQVTAPDAGAFHFALVGGMPDDPGLNFQQTP
ncbi:MAG: tetratricopeptide repeat protein [Planctomyces sp.]|nr:tetratricopeptide repeat protein [Planctomyces sp.]